MDSHQLLPMQLLLFLGSSKIKEVIQFKNITIHSQISQHTVCPQALTPPIPHIYNRKSMCVCMHVSVPMFVLLHSPSCSIRSIFTCFLSASVKCISYLMWNRNSHVVMALCSTVHLPQSVLDLGTVKRPLVACLVGYAWVSELCASSANRQLDGFNML